MQFSIFCNLVVIRTRDGIIQLSNTLYECYYYLSSAADKHTAWRTFSEPFINTTRATDRRADD